MKVNGFFKDILGSSRVIKERRHLIEEADPNTLYDDPINEVARQLHPDRTHVKVTAVKDVSPSARTITFTADQNDILPPFQCGQYVSLEFEIDGTLTTRPYSISSAPFQAREIEEPFFEITVRNGKRGQSFVSCWLYDNVKPGDTFIAHLPFGQFYVEPLRDSKHIVALAGGSGITPFCSMAREIEHGTLDVDLTILYGSVSTRDIILKEQLEAIQSPRVRIIHVISDQPEYPGEKGFLTARLIEKYAQPDSTFFVCGPLPMYRFVYKELKKLQIPDKRIRMEVFGAPVNIMQEEGYPLDMQPQTFRLLVVRGIHEDVVEAKSTEPLAVALERAAIKNHTRCRSGACGACRCKLISGKVFIPSTGDGRRAADKQYSYVHACSTYPLSDCTIKIPIL